MKLVDKTVNEVGQYRDPVLRRHPRWASLHPATLVILGTRALREGCLASPDQELEEDADTRSEFRWLESRNSKMPGDSRVDPARLSEYIAKHGELPSRETMLGWFRSANTVEEERTARERVRVLKGKRKNGLAILAVEEKGTDPERRTKQVSERKTRLEAIEQELAELAGKGFH